MDPQRKLTKLLRNRQGIVLLVVAACMVMILFFMGLAIDLSFRHVARTELQNAADSAALAGATRLPDTTAVRAIAIQYAAANPAAASTSVSILSDGSNTLSDRNDVVLGNYNAFRSGPPFIAGGAPVNAVQVQARRTMDAASAAEQGKVDLFFSGVFGWPRVAVSASSIALRDARAGGYFLLSPNLCTATTFPLAIDTKVTGTGSYNMAWTSLTAVPTGPGANVSDAICQDAVPDIDIGPSPAAWYTTNGQATAAFRDLEGTFYDPNYDTLHKTFGAGGAVTSWKLIVPVAVNVDPTTPPKPCPVWGYAEIVISRVCASGGGTGGACRPYSAPHGVCGGSETDIVISSINCATYEDRGNLLGAKAYLVRGNAE